MNRMVCLKFVRKLSEPQERKGGRKRKVERGNQVQK